MHARIDAIKESVRRKAQLLMECGKYQAVKENTTAKLYEKCVQPQNLSTVADTLAKRKSDVIRILNDLMSEMKGAKHTEMHPM